jgi:hypothetical protein
MHRPCVALTQVICLVVEQSQAVQVKLILQSDIKDS